jgi:putative acetyltransferase
LQPQAASILKIEDSCAGSRVSFRSGDTLATLARDTMTIPPLTLRPYTAADEDAAIELWRRTWAQHYPQIDFNARVAWWRERWRRELVPVAAIVLAEANGTLAGFVTVDPKTMYLDQIVVAPEQWGSGVALALLDEAKRLSPNGLDLLVNKDNARAIGFYAKHGFAYAGEDKNPVSGKPVSKMTWRA